MISSFSPLRGLFRILTSVRGFWISAAGYVALVFAVRLLALPGASQDDAEQLLFAQVLAPSYNPSQPPLYTWLVVAAERILGVGLGSVAVVKFAGLFAIYAFLHGAARRVLADARLAALAALSPLGLYYVAWDAVLNYSNTVLMAAASAATVHALAAVMDGGRRRAYAALGLAVGVGLLAKYGYAVFAGALLLAALSVPAARARLISKRGLISLAVAGLIVLPHALWLAGAAADVAAGVGARFDVAGGQGYIAGVVNGLLKLANAVVWFLFPLILVSLVAFPRAWLPIPAWKGNRPAFARVLERAFVLALAMIVAGILFFGVYTVRTHYMFILLPAPIYFFLRVQALGTDERRAARFAGALATLAFTAVVGLGLKGAFDPAWCRKCYFHVPYEALARDMRAAGFEGGTIVAHFRRYHLAGNLRRHFPDSRLMSTKYPSFMPPAPVGAPSGDCLLVWEAAAGAAPPRALVDLARTRLDVTGLEDAAVRIAEAPLVRDRERRFAVRYVLIKGGRGSCR